MDLILWIVGGLVVVTMLGKKKKDTELTSAEFRAKYPMVAAPDMSNLSAAEFRAKYPFVAAPDLPMMDTTSAPPPLVAAPNPYADDGVQYEGPQYQDGSYFH